jgi:hypothetical protein
VPDSPSPHLPSRATTQCEIKDAPLVDDQLEQFEISVSRQRFVDASRVAVYATGGAPSMAEVHTMCSFESH